MEISIMKNHDKVIVRDNSDNPYWIGEFLGYANLDNSPDAIPNVKDDAGETYMCCGHVIPYSEEMTARLDKLAPEDQWTLLTTIKEGKDGKELILMRGLPGSGKSTKAKVLAGDLGQVFSTDDFFSMSGEYVFNGDALGKAHAWNQRRSLDAMKLGIPIVVIDNTNTTLRELRSYLPHINLARQLGYTLRVEEPETSWRFDVDKLVELNSHGVPKAAIERMLKRYLKDVQVEDIIFLFSHPSTYP
jgi:predicted kinase